MSIRKPHNHVTTISANGTGGYSNVPEWVTSTYDEDSYKVLNSGIRISKGWGDIGEQVEMRKPKFIPTPDWVEKIEGHVTECFEMGGYDVGVIAVCYKPDHTLGVGFAKVYIVDKKTRKPFPQMKGVWKETKNRDATVKLDAMFRNLYSKCGIDEEGRLSGAFGVPDLPAMCNVIQDMLVVWDEWREFPNESDFSMVKRLKQAKQDVAAMQSQMTHKYIEKDIEEYRKEIKESQEKIAKLEKELNEICEKAADGMNLLEEHGVKIDLDDKKAEKDYDGTSEGYADYSCISHAYPGQGIMIEPPPSGTLLSTLPPETFQLSKEELEILQKEWGDPASELTVYNGAGISSAHDVCNAVNSVCASLSCAS
jgi:hypothetical protein